MGFCKDCAHYQPRNPRIEQHLKDGYCSAVVRYHDSRPGLAYLDAEGGETLRVKPEFGCVMFQRGGER